LKTFDLVVADWSARYRNAAFQELRSIGFEGQKNPDRQWKSRPELGLASMRDGLASR